MFGGWDSYYLLIGGAGGALIGLLFVVATLTTDVEREQALRGAALYLTPTAFNFGAVVTASAIALAPKLPATVAGALVLAGGLAGFGYTLPVALRLVWGKAPLTTHWSDRWFYGLLPAALYLALAIGGALAWRAPAVAPYLMAAASLALLLVGVRNAWDLVTWLAPRSARASA